MKEKWHMSRGIHVGKAVDDSHSSVKLLKLRSRLRRLAEPLLAYSERQPFDNRRKPSMNPKVALGQLLNVG
jgi:hypothetical protein